MLHVVANILFLFFPDVSFGSKNPEWVIKFVKTEVQSLNLDRHKPINFIEKLRRIAL